MAYMSQDLQRHVRKYYLMLLNQVPTAAYWPALFMQPHFHQWLLQPVVPPPPPHPPPAVSAPSTPLNITNLPPQLYII